MHNTVDCDIFFVLLFFKKPFVLGLDQEFQYNIYYREWVDLIKRFISGEGLPLYSWNMFFGTDIWSSMSYYVIGDLFVPFIVLFNYFGVTVNTMLIVETIICIYVSALLFNRYLEYLNINNKSIKVVFSLLYAFGDWALVFYGQYMFHRFYALLPLLFISIERYYKNGSRYLFSVSVFLLLLQCYYFMYPALIVSFIYCLSIETKKKSEIKIVIRDFIDLFFAFIIGLLSSAVLILPTVFYILSNPRVGLGTSEIFWEFKTYVGVFISSINSQFPAFTNFNNIFYIDGGSHDYSFTMFIGIIPFMSSLSYILKKENRSDLYMTIVLLLILLFKPLSSVIHGFSEPSFRWMFILELYLLQLAAKDLEFYNDKNTKLFVIYIVFSLLLVFILFFKENLSTYKEQLISMLICFVFALVIWIAYIKCKNETIILIISFLEVFMLSLNLQLVFNQDYFYYDERINKEEVLWYQSIDDDLMYRMYIDTFNIHPNGVLNFNKTLDYGFMSTKTYNSLYDHSTDLFLRINNLNSNVIVDLNDPYSVSSIGTKYWIVNKENELPKELSFEYVYNISDLKVYRNLDFYSFAHTGNKLEYLDKLTSTKDFLSTIYVDRKEVDINNYSNLEIAKLDIVEKGNNYLIGEISLCDSNVLFIPLPNNKGWNIKVNGMKAETINVNGGFIGVLLNKGYSEIKMNYIPIGFKSGLVVSLAGVLVMTIMYIKEKN